MADTLFPHTEQRGAERAPIALLRAAKLITEAGEYVCLVRDVSATGVRLQLFHAMPAEEHVFLEMPHGEVFPMLRVWEKDRQAGFRFAAPIDVAAFLAEAGQHPRRMLRLRMRRPGMAHAGGTRHAITLRDLSQNGAGFTCRDYLPLAQPLVLQIEGLPDHAGWVRWRQGHDYGMVFEASMRLDQLATQALALQPVLTTANEAAQARRA